MSKQVHSKKKSTNDSGGRLLSNYDLWVGVARKCTVNINHTDADFIHIFSYFQVLILLIVLGGL